MIFILYIGLHKKRQNASCSFECENRVSTEKRQEMGEGRSESGQWRLLVINVPKRLSGCRVTAESPLGCEHVCLKSYAIEVQQRASRRGRWVLEFGARKNDLFRHGRIQVGVVCKIRSRPRIVVRDGIKVRIGSLAASQWTCRSGQ